MKTKQFPTLLDYARKLDPSGKIKKEIKEAQKRQAMFGAITLDDDMFSCLPWTNEGRKEIAQKAVFDSRGDSV